MKEIKLPINGADTPIQSEHSFVIIGANGSGKSHLGAWIEKKSMNTTLRISAQRALSIKDNIAIKSEESSFYKIMYGSEDLNAYTKSKVHKWGNDDYTTKLVDDYDSVISGIFAKNNKENEDFINECRSCETKGLQHPQVPIILGRYAKYGMKSIPTDSWYWKMQLLKPNQIQIFTKGKICPTESVSHYIL